ncbi:MAG: YdcF family protein [Leptolyngbyaceae cyanobacterium]
MPKFRVVKGFLLATGGAVLLCFGWVGYRTLKSYLTEPDAILVLGGTTGREEFAAKFAQTHLELPIWVSGGSNPEYTEAVFFDAGINRNRLHIDRSAVDTLTNFTSLVDEFKRQDIRQVYLITSDYHMRRAQVIGEIIFGSRGILLKPVEVRTQYEPEPLSKSLRDGARAVFWLATGRTGSTLVRRLGDR